MANIFISYPTYRYAEPESKKCLEDMMMHMIENKHRVALDSPIGGSMITRVRNRSLGRFIRDGSFDWFMSIDSDIVFNKNLVEILLSHSKEVIGAVYRAKQKKVASTCVAIQKPGTEWGAKTIDIGCGVHEMKYLSGGCMMVNMSVIMDMVEKYKDLKYSDDFSNEEIWALYNPMIIDDGAGHKRLLSEDWAFCERISDIGVKLFADTDIRLGHFAMMPLVFPQGKE